MNSVIKCKRNDKLQTCTKPYTKPSMKQGEGKVRNEKKVGVVEGVGGEGISTAISISESTNQSLSRYANSSPAYLHANNPTDVPKRALWVLILNGLADLTGKDNVSTGLAPVTGTFLK